MQITVKVLLICASKGQTDFRSLPRSAALLCCGLRRQVAIKLCLLIEHLGIDTALCIQLGMRSVFSDVPVVEHRDPIRELNG